MRIGRVILFALAGVITGGIGGLLLPGFRGYETRRLGLSALMHLAVLGALVASAGPLVERHWRKLFVAWVTGAVSAILLALLVLGLAQWGIGGQLTGVLVVVAAFALYPAAVALADCLADEAYRAILYETTFSALGGVVGFAASWPMLFLRNNRTRLALATAIYGGVIWLMMALAKWEEASEEELEAEELSEEKLEAAGPAGEEPPSV